MFFLIIAVEINSPVQLSHPSSLSPWIRTGVASRVALRPSPEQDRVAIWGHVSAPVFQMGD